MVCNGKTVYNATIYVKEQRLPMKLSKSYEGFFLAKSADGLSPSTLAIYRWALDKLLGYLGDVDLETISTDDLRRWLVWLREEYQPRGIRAKERLSIASIQDAWRALKSFYAWAQRDLDLPRIDDIRRPSGESPPVVPFTVDEVRALLKAAEHFSMVRYGQEIQAKRPTARRNVAMLMVLLDTGVRVGELTRLNVSDVNVASGEVVIRPFRSGKKTSGRLVYLGKAARRSVWRYLSEREVDGNSPLFTTDDSKRMRPNAILTLLVSIGSTAGVYHVHPHRFRHTFAIQFLRNGGNAFILQNLLGHNSLEMVKRYLRLIKEDVSGAMHAASPVDFWGL